MAQETAWSKIGDDQRSALWEEVQKKTFCGWINMHLSTRQLTVNNLDEDFCDGVKLIALLEILHGKPIEGRYYRNPKSKPYKIDNVNFALNFITDNLKIKLISCSAEDIVDGNVKIILGMCWRLIQKFQLTTDNSRQTLLNWCKELTSTYPNLEIENFQSSFSDGLLFCALVHKFDSTLFNFESLKSENKLDNLQKAFTLAEKHLEVPKLLDPKDIINGLVDERSLMTYISLLQQAFERQSKSPQKLSAPAAKDAVPVNVAKAPEVPAEVEKLQKEHERLLEELERLKKDLNDEKRLRSDLKTEQIILESLVKKKENEKKSKEQAKEESKEQKKEDVKEEVKEEPKVEVKEEIKEEPKEVKEEVKEVKEEPKEEVKEEVKEESKEESREIKEVKEEAKEEIKEEAKEESREIKEVKEEGKGESKEESSESKDDAKVRSKKTKRRKSERISRKLLRSQLEPKEKQSENLEDLQKQLAEKDLKIIELEKEVQDTRNKLREQSKVSETLQKSLEDTREEIGLIQKRHKRAQDKDAKKQQKRLEKRLARREKELETTKLNSENEITEKNNEIERLKAQIKKAQTALGSIEEQPKESPILDDIEFLKTEYQSFLPIIFNFEEEEKTLALRSAKPKMEVPDEPDDEEK